MKRSRVAWIAVLPLCAALIAWQYRRSARTVAVAGGISEPAAAQMEQKLAQIVDQAARPERSPATTVLWEDEINSYFQYRMGARIPPGVSNVRLDLHRDRPSGTAMVDFEQVKAASKKPVNPILDQLLSGRKPIAVAGRFTSARGTGLFHLEQVSVGGFTLRGTLLDLVIRHFVLPRYPHVAIDRPFPLPARIDQVAVEEGRARIDQR